ncbi:hypothetical protein PUNSTDRAFT_120102, partial [Punctularia strigosozonata HHB-11173 SS5]|uniref:uncharacterized protein n=1 Tax=Punctularia strigosozonata (strain HHB-11173) TaxID=741275 RepID=UPI0004416E45
MHSLLSHLKLPFKRRQKATSVLIHSRPHELPLELIEEILHHVYTDLTRYDGRPSVFRTEFRSLVLVSQAWYSAGIALLYAEPYLPSFHSLSSFSRTVSRQPALASH